MTDFFYATGEFFEWTFRFMEKLGMLPNFIFMAIGAIAFLTWMNMQRKYNREAEQNGTLK